MNLKQIRHYLLIHRSGLFDGRYYLRRYPDIRYADIDPLAHYVKIGWHEGRIPSEQFDAAYYLQTYPDVGQAGVNPLVHYLLNGKAEGRQPRSAPQAPANAGQPGTSSSDKSQAPKQKLHRIVLVKTFQLLRSIYRKLPLSASFRYKLRTFINRHFPSAMNLTRRMGSMSSAVEWIRDRETSLSATFTAQNPFRYGEEYASYYALLLGEERSAALPDLMDPPWYTHPKTEIDPGTRAKNPRPRSKQPLPRFTILCIEQGAPAYLLFNAIQSVLRQTYTEWNLEIWTENKNWDTEVLSIQFAKHAAKVHFHALSASVDTPARFMEAVLPTAGDYLTFLSPYDALNLEALANLAKDAVSRQPDLALSRGRQPELHRLAPAEVVAPGVSPFAQLVSLRKEALVQQLSSSPALAEGDWLSWWRNLIISVPAHSVAWADEANYWFRPIPGRKILSITENEGKIQAVEGILPFKIVLDARLLDRKVTGTERYIRELLKGLCQIREEIHLDLRAIAFVQPKEAIEGVTFVTENHLVEILSAHVFHKTFPASDHETLTELALAPAVAFTPHDLIAYNHPDYFPAEASYYNYRSNLHSALQFSDMVVSHAHHGKLELMRQLHLPDEKIRVALLGIQTNQFTESPQADAKLLQKYNLPEHYYFFIGTDYPHKNLVTLLKALKIVAAKIPQACLVTVGAQYHISPQREVKELLKSLGDRVIQLGHVPDELVPTLYHHAKAMVFPSLYEGFGLPVLEAMAFDTPVIASTTTSVPEVCGDAALTFDGYDVERLANLMLQVWTDQDLRQHLIQLGRKNVANFSWEKTARVTAAAYIQAAANAMAHAPDQRVQARSAAIKTNPPHCPAILIVTHIRFFPPTAGNEMRLFKLVRYLKKLGYQVFMLVNPFMDPTPLENSRRRAIHEFVDYYEELNDRPEEKYTGGTPPNRSSLLEKWQPTEWTFCPDELLAKAKQLIQTLSPEIILAEYIWTTRIFELAGQDTLKVIDLHDLFSQKKANVVKFQIQDTLAITAEEELAFINRADIALAIQENEADILRNLQPACEVITAGIDYEVDFLDQHDSQEHSLLIVGSDNQINVVCVNEFLTTAWPIIQQRTPHCVLKIVGKVCNAIKGSYHQVELLSYVADLDAVYRQASVVINPVYAGTGLKIKSVEAIGHGKALVSWQEGISGIMVDPAAAPFIVIDSWQALAEQVTELLSNREKKAALEESAKAYARTYLSDHHVYRQVGDRFDSHSRRDIKLLCLFLRYGPDHHPDSLPTLLKWYRQKQQTGSVTPTVWIIDNKIEHEFEGIDLTTGLRLISGNNAQREFSGFQQVVERYREEIGTYDVVHFVTSAFDMLYTGYRESFSFEHLVPVLHRPVCLGHIDTYDQPVQLMGSTSQSWIRTCFFFMSPRTLDRISDLNSFKDENLFLDAEGEFLDNGNIDSTYIQSIRQWLTGRQMQGVSWHSAIRDGQDFKAKALTILNEHMLSIRMRAFGIKMVDYYWLLKNFAEVNASPEAPIPDPLEQVRVRQADLFNQ